MQPQSWDEIEQLYALPHIDQDTVKQFRALKSSQDSHTKKEGNANHYCSFFLPVDRDSGRIYLCHHIKADDWIPPGGHIDPDETPSDAAVREMQEELNTTITKDQLQAWNLSIKPINRPEHGCIIHYDIWHLIDIKEQVFDYDPREYHDDGWFDIQSGVAKISRNPDFASIISQINLS